LSIRYSFVGILALAQVLMASMMALPAQAQVSGALYLSPATGTHTIGSSFTVSVRVNTGGQPVNASDGFITYDASQLAVVGVSRSGSIFNLWTSEPAFSNDAGSVTYSGGTPTPYTGNGGSIMAITFRALREGASTVRFSSGSILAADGKGTNIVGSLGSGVYVLGAAIVTPITPPPPRPNTPGAPTITSDTHPDADRWYPNPNVQISWNLLTGTIGVRTAINRNANAVPRQVQSSSATSQIFEGIDDGIWYAHVQLQNTNGWGSVAHYRVQIDTEDPTLFKMSEIDRDDLTNPRVGFTLQGEDATSGISYFDIQIDGGDSIRFEDAEKVGVYQTNALPPGTHTIIITAYDGAGNNIIDSEQFHINAIGAPKITEYTERLRTSDIFVARGETFQNATVIVTISPRGGQGELTTGEVQSGTDGEFTFVLDGKLAEGAWDLTAIVRDIRGATSNSSDELPVIVGPSVIAQAGKSAINFFSILIPLLGVLFLAGFLLWYGWHRFRMFLGLIEEETKQTESDIHEEFEKLRVSLREHLAALEHASTKRELSREENRMREEISEQLQESEKRLLGEVSEIEQQVIAEEHPIRRLIRKLRKR